jgi:hypothetical protein
MEKKSKKNNIIYRNVFNNINFVKGTKINYHYMDAMHKLNNFSNKVNNFIDYVEKSIEKDMALSGRFNKNIFRTLMNQKKNFNGLGDKTNKFNSNRSLRLVTKLKPNKMNYSLEIPTKKRIINNLARTKSNKNIKEINNYQQKGYSILRKGPNPLNHLSNSTIINNSRKFTNLFKTRNESVSNSKLNSGSKSSKNGIYNFNFFHNKNSKNIRPQSATMTNSINEYNYKPTISKNKSQNISKKNISLSLYRPKKHYFSNYKNILKPEILMKFIKSSKKMKKSYQKDLEVNMNSKTKKLLKLAENEINMKDPDFYHKQIFKNVLQIKKTMKAVQRMRAEHKTKVRYFGPGNINNESLMRTKNAKIVKFCDSITLLKDDKFYEYRKVLNEMYPNLSKGAFKQKYQISEKDEIYEKKLNDNKLKIDRLFALIQKINA